MFSGIFVKRETSGRQLFAEEFSSMVALPLDNYRGNRGKKT
jgi:hypothetical protein